MEEVVFPVAPQTGPLRTAQNSVPGRTTALNTEVIVLDEQTVGSVPSGVVLPTLAGRRETQALLLLVPPQSAVCPAQTEAAPPNEHLHVAALETGIPPSRADAPLTSDGLAPRPLGRVSALMARRAVLDERHEGASRVKAVTPVVLALRHTVPRAARDEVAEARRPLVPPIH